MSILKISFVTDIHNGPSAGNKYGEKAVRLTEKFVEATNKYAPDLAIDMGDRVTMEDPETDRDRMLEIKSIFNDLACPFHAIDGNHDLKHLSAEENAEIMGQPKGSYSVESQGFHIVFWKLDLSAYNDHGIEISDKELEWLERDLSKTDKPTIIVTHVPLDDKKGGLDSDNNPTKRFAYPNANKARKIIEDSGHVILCIGGHRHTNSHKEINGVHYLTLQSLVQGQKGEGKRSPHGTFAFAEFDTEQGQMQIRLQGKYKKTYDLEFNIN